MKKISLKTTSSFAAAGCVTAMIGLCSSPAFAAPALQGYVMRVQMTPAVCALDSSRQKTRQCLEGYSLTIAGLLPEITEEDCTTSSSANLSPIQANVVSRIMPGENSRAQLWHSVGGCLPMNASQYFRTIINYAERLKIPADLTGSVSRQMQNNSLKQQFLKLNPALPNNGIRFSCESLRGTPVLTEVQVCYRVNGQYKQCSSEVVSSCPGSFTVKGAY